MHDSIPDHPATTAVVAAVHATSSQPVTLASSEQQSGLAFTGFDASLTAVAGTALIGGGVILVRLSRRRSATVGIPSDPRV
jgi:hypothetical protein